MELEQQVKARAMELERQAQVCARELEQQVQGSVMALVPPEPRSRPVFGPAPVEVRFAAAGLEPVAARSVVVAAPRTRSVEERRPSDAVKFAEYLRSIA